MGESKRRHDRKGESTDSPSSLKEIQSDSHLLAAEREVNALPGRNNSFIGAKSDRRLLRNDPGLFGQGPEWWVGDDVVAVARRVKRWLSSRRR
jgi:hypothetical protein